MLEHLLEQFLQHRDRKALARLLTLVARGECVEEIEGWLANRIETLEDDESSSGVLLDQPQPCHEPPRVVAITGSGGVGKSTLIGKLIERLRQQSQSVAVLACDPQSSITGGALLGDRIRMSSQPDDVGVFIRSVAVPSGNESIAPNIAVMIALLARYGFGTVILETAGAGQGDTRVRQVADVVVVLVQPEMGDELQWEKAGLLEVADIVVVHKADLPAAEQVETQLRGMLSLPGCRAVPVLRVSSSKGFGVGELWHAIEAAPLKGYGAAPT